VATLSNEQRAYAIASLQPAMDSRGFNQQELHRRSGVAQSTISRILSPSGDDQYEPSDETLRKLFKGLGLNLDEIIGASEALPKRITAYLASPLTGIVGDERTADSLYRLVDRVRKVVCSDVFPEPKFDVYWPGDYTHPQRNKDFTASQVYLTDRSQASSFDFVLMICAAASFGVGQENEIVTQSGLPAIRLIPHGLSRMMRGSFLDAIDIAYTGDLYSGIDVPEDKLIATLQEIRTRVFEQRALYRNKGDDFRIRLANLIQDRCGNTLTFARRLGVNVGYANALLNESLAVSNPSAQLLRRMSLILHVGVGFLLGETEESNAVWIESMANWNEWARNSRGLEASIVVSIRDDWRDQFRRESKLQCSPVATRPISDIVRKPMSVEDWQTLYIGRAPRFGATATTKNTSLPQSKSA
jgi:transcriptional regulator with XRE-family HTH domain